MHTSKAWTASRREWIAKSDAESTALLVVNNNIISSIQSVIQAGADIETKDKNGATALFVAVQQNHLEIAFGLNESWSQVDTFKFQEQKEIIFNKPLLSQSRSILPICNDWT